jgi:hypothetical protein
LELGNEFGPRTPFEALPAGKGDELGEGDPPEAPDGVGDGVDELFAPGVGVVPGACVDPGVVG